MRLFQRGVAGIEKNMSRGVSSLGKKLAKGRITQEQHDTQVAELTAQIEAALPRIKTSVDLGAHARLNWSWKPPQKMWISK